MEEEQELANEDAPGPAAVEEAAKQQPQPDEAAARSKVTDGNPIELVGEALAPGAGAAMVTPEASPGLTPCGCRIQPTPFFQ